MAPVFAAFAITVLLGATMVAAYGGWRGGMSEEERNAIRGAVQNGDYAAWKAVKESGLTQERFNKLRARHLEMEKRRSAIEAAFEANDFEAWKSAVSESGRGSKMLEFVNKDNFALFAEMHKAMQSGNFERANEIRAELELPDKGACGFGGEGFGRGMHAMARPPQ